MSILHDFDQNEKSKIVKINIGTCMKKIFKQKKIEPNSVKKKHSLILRDGLFTKKKQFYTSLKIRINIKVGN